MYRITRIIRKTILETLNPREKAGTKLIPGSPVGSLSNTNNVTILQEIVINS